MSNKKIKKENNKFMGLGLWINTGG